MKYRTKLYIAFISISFISSAVGLSIIMTTSRNLVFDLFRSQVISVAATTAALIDADLLQKINSGVDTNPVDCINIRDQLRKARGANQRRDVYIRYLYSLFVSPDDPTLLIYGMDAEGDPVQICDVGGVYVEPDATDFLENRLGYFANPEFVYDEWGGWLSGTAPVFNSSGQYISTMAADLRATDLLLTMNRIILYTVWALLGSVILSLSIAIFLSKTITLSLASLYRCVKQIGGGNLDSQVSLHTKDEFADLARAINDMTKGLKERERIKVNFSRYVSEHILDKILHSETTLSLEGERRKVTLLFTDIREFTSLAEKLPPEQIVSLLNEYFGKMLHVIFQFHGTLDKFIGDSIMVEFGAPLEDTEQERHALAAAIGMQKELKKLCESWTAQGKPSIEMGIGIHTGFAVVGNVGSEKRMEYTAIGDTVNVAARIEQMTRMLKIPILVSESTFDPVKNEFAAQSLGPKLFPGKTKEITIYAVDPNQQPTRFSKEST